MHTGADGAIEMARSLLRLNERAPDWQYDHSDTVHIGKFAWGSAALYEVAPDDQLLANLVHMASWLQDCQLPDGSWNPSAFLFPNPEPPDALWKTAEHIMIIDMMLAAIGGSPRGGQRAETTQTARAGSI